MKQKLFFLLLPICALAQPGMHFAVDLTAVKADRLAVQCTPTPPKAYLDTAKVMAFRFPAIVPGIYGKMNFGQYVSDFQAFDKQNKPLPVTHPDQNSWAVARPRDVRTIRYTVADTWDDFGKEFRNGFFKSAGAMFRKDSVFLINHNCLFGYIDGLEGLPQQLEIRRPAGFYGATALGRTGSQGKDTDVFTAASYFDMVDAPLLYARPDTAWLQVANARVLVAVYAEQPGRYAPSIAAGIRTLLEHQKSYLGGVLPVDHYAFLIYHTPSPDSYNSAGDALEHSHSSFYLFMTSGLGSVSGMVRDIAAHEFFHIVTPLNIHGEPIEYYDYNEPVLSQHLWLYEGMTEYATIHMPVKEGLVSLQDFLKTVDKKEAESGQFDASLPLTTLSLHAIDRQDQYYNVYLKGALVGLCLDGLLREKSGGQYGTQDLLRRLSADFGPDKPFKEDTIFEYMAALTYPEVQLFFQRYVAGAAPLPLEATFAKAGIKREKGQWVIDKNASAAQRAFRKSWLGQE